MSLATFLETDKAKEAADAAGGIQGWKGTLFGIPYAAGSWPDHLIEAFGWSHDVIGGKLQAFMINKVTHQEGEVRLIRKTWSVPYCIRIEKSIRWRSGRCRANGII